MIRAGGGDAPRWRGRAFSVWRLYSHFLMVVTILKNLRDGMDYGDSGDCLISNKFENI